MMFRRLILALALILTAPLAAMAQAPSDVVSLTIRPGWETNRGTRMIGLHMRLAPGWHTYWRQPGEAGIPPQFDFRGSGNLKGLQVHWPTPQIFRQNSMVSLGYEGEVILPLELAMDRPGAIDLKGELMIGVCRDICVPVTLPVSVRIPAEGGKDAALRSALRDQPKSARAAGLPQATCSIEAIADGVRVTVGLRQVSGAHHVVIEPANSAIWVSSPEVTRHAKSLSATAEMVPPDGKPFLLQRSDLRVTLISDGSVVEYRGCRAPS